MNTYHIPSRNFVAIDVEYADHDQNICQVGVAVVRDLEISECRSWLIQPPGNYYEENQMRVHHITPADTEHQLSFEELWPEIQPYLLKVELWAHNAVSVEQPVLEKNLRGYGIPSNWLNIHDSRSLYQRPGCPPNVGNGLEQCCMALGICCENHHDACADAEMCAKIVIAYANGQKPIWDGVPQNNEQMRKQQQEKRTLRLGDFKKYYEGNVSGQEDVFCELTSTCSDSKSQIVDVFDKGDKTAAGKTVGIDYSRLNISPNNPLNGKKVVVTGLFSIDRKDIEKAVEAMGAKRVPKPARNTDAVILGTRNVGFTKLCAIEEQEEKGHHIALIVGDADLEILLYGDGEKFFK